MRNHVVLMTVLLLAMVFPLSAVADGPEKMHCAQCGMLVDEASPYSSRIVMEGKNLWFCDIGDMVLYLREKKIDPALVQVKDYRTGAWIAASQAFYVSSPKKFRTPMGWGLAAFQSRAEASGFGDADDLATILQRIK